MGTPSPTIIHINRRQSLPPQCLCLHKHIILRQQNIISISYIISPKAKHHSDPRSAVPPKRLQSKHIVLLAVYRICVGKYIALTKSIYRLTARGGVYKTLLLCYDFPVTLGEILWSFFTLTKTFLLL